MHRVVFMGSPDVAVPALRVIAATPGLELAAVFSQPDRPVGRGRKLQPCPVAAEARELGVPVHGPEKIRAPEGLALLEQARPDLLLVCAYGQILPQAILTLPPRGPFNLHFSLLPRWRGASPVQAAILAGDSTTGVSLQRMVRELDAGPIAAETEPLPILPGDTAQTLAGRLAEAAAELLRSALPSLLEGSPTLREQHVAEATFCRTIRKEAGRVDWAEASATEVERRVRAYSPWPGCYSFLGALRLGLERVELADLPGAEEQGAPPPPGTITEDGLVGAREGFLRLLEVKPAGKGAMPFSAFLNGTPGAVGARLTPWPEGNGE